jgi:membrane-associated protease RseP (regulator of RpoE activity)
VFIDLRFNVIFRKCITFLSYTVQSEVPEVEQPKSPSEEMPPPYIAPSSVSEDHPHRARLCVVISRKDGRGYGFSMQGQKAGAENPSKAQFIGKVDAGSPAEEAGLRNGDKIVEVNGTNVENSAHKEVVEKIKSIPDKVKLLVVDAEADKYFTSKGITLTSSMEDCVEIRSSSEPGGALGKYIVYSQNG